MTVYLIHLAQPLAGIAQHYIGWTTSPANVAKRLEHHRAGSGARFTAVCNKRGIAYDVVRTWPQGDKTFERCLKNQKHAARLCPICNPLHAEKNKCAPS